MIDFGIFKLLGYAGAIGYLSLTGGVSYHGISVRPCAELMCYRPSVPPVGSYWVYRDGKYLAAYNGRIWPGQRHLAGFWH
jgi:hypothetical protein